MVFAFILELLALTNLVDYHNCIFTYRSTGPLQKFFSNWNIHNTGEIVYGRYVQDLPSLKLARIENITNFGFCLPENFIPDIHKLVTKKKQGKSEEVTKTAIEGTFNKRSCKAPVIKKIAYNEKIFQ